VHYSVHPENRPTIQALAVARRKRTTRVFVARPRSARQELRSNRLCLMELGPAPRAEREYLAKAVRRARWEKRTAQSRKGRLARQSATQPFLVRRNKPVSQVVMAAEQNPAPAEQLAPQPLAKRELAEKRFRPVAGPAVSVPTSRPQSPHVPAARRRTRWRAGRSQRHRAARPSRRASSPLPLCCPYPW